MSVNDLKTEDKQRKMTIIFALTEWPVTMKSTGGMAAELVEIGVEFAWKHNGGMHVSIFDYFKLSKRRLIMAGWKNA